MGLNRLQPRQILNAEEDCDPTACYDSFKEHWLQAYQIILRNQVRCNLMTLNCNLVN